MAIKITNMVNGAPVNGTEILATSKSSAPRRVTTADIKTYVVDQIEAISAGSAPSGSDSLFVLQGGVLKPIDIDLVVTYALAAMWAKTPETAVDDLDVLTLHDGGATQKTVTAKILSDYILAEIENAILDVSDLADGSGAIATSDFVLVTQGTTPKRVTIANISTLIYNSLATHVTGRSDISTPTGTDYLYLVRGSTGYYLNMDDLSTYVQSALTLSGSGSTGLLADWSSTNVLQATYSISTSFTVGSATAIPTTAAVRGEMDTIIEDAGAIGEALADADQLLVYNASLTAQAFALLSAVWTYILAKIVAITDVSTHGWVVDEDTMTSNSATKVPTQQSVKAYVDTSNATVAISTIDIDGGSDIGAALVDADLLIVDDGGAGTNRKAAMTRVGEYIKTYPILDELYIDASQMYPRTTEGCAALAQVESAVQRINWKYLAFDTGATEEKAQFKLVMPPQWNRGTIKAKFLWTSATGSTSGDTVEWGLKGGALSDSDVIETALGTEQVISDVLLADDGTDVQLSGATPVITIAGTPALGDLITFEVHRNTDGTDNMAEDAWLLGVVIQFTKDQAVAAW